MTIPIKIIPAKDLKEKPDQKKIWDIISVPWEKYVVKELSVVSRFLNKVGLELKNSKKHKKRKIVDLGCGSGRNMIKNEDVEYYAVDFSDEQLKNAEKYAKDENVNAKFFNSKIDDLSMFEDDFFDYGLFIATLHCLESEKERKNALEEFYRILKPNAEGLISVWNSEDARFNGLKQGVYMSWRDKGIDYMRYYYLYDKDELINLLKKVGFKIEEIYRSELHDRFSKKNLIIRVKK